MDQPAFPPRESRKRVRCCGVFPLRIRGGGGEHFELTSLADNLSSDGFYAQLPHAVALGTLLFALVRLPSGSLIAARGIVLRVEPRPFGLYGMAVQFRHARLLAG
jgi:hypothetical protein